MCYCTTHWYWVLGTGTGYWALGRPNNWVLGRPHNAQFNPRGPMVTVSCGIIQISKLHTQLQRTGWKIKPYPTQMMVMISAVGKNVVRMQKAGGGPRFKACVARGCCWLETLDSSAAIAQLLPFLQKGEKTKTPKRHWIFCNYPTTHIRAKLNLALGGESPL